jgi:sec-independent protein translocase protein TatA
VIEDLFSPEKLIILFVILFFLFGAKKLPGLGKSLGHGIREFRTGVSGAGDDAPVEELTPAADQTALAAADSGAQVADTTVAPDTIVATEAPDAPDATAVASAVASDPALDDADIEDADYTELDGDVTSEVVGEMSEAEGAVAAPGQQA